MHKESIELEPLFTLSSPYEKARYFCTLVIQELGIHHSFLTPEEAASFAKYYGNLDTKGDNRRNHFIHRHAQRVQHLVSVATEGKKVLDAGCGLGSESILCGILGAQVTGVDLMEPWLNTAKKRVQFYEGLLGRKISTELHAQSVLDIHGSFDVIWAMESISHIDPAEAFIAFAHDHLNRGGKLIISDANKLNPLIYWNARRASEKWGGLHTLARNPKTGEMIPIAHERVFAVFSIKKLLWDNGFTIESFHYSAQLPYEPHCNVGYKNISIYLERLMNPIRPLRWLSGIYTVVASRI